MISAFIRVYLRFKLHTNPQGWAAGEWENGVGAEQHFNVNRRVRGGMQRKAKTLCVLYGLKITQIIYFNSWWRQQFNIHSRCNLKSVSKKQLENDIVSS